MTARIKQVGNRYALILPDGTFLKMFDFQTMAILYCLDRGMKVEVER